MILIGHVIDKLKALAAADTRVQLVVTSPPYWSLRKYQGEQEQVWLSPQSPAAVSSGPNGHRDTESHGECQHQWGATMPGMLYLRVPHLFCLI